MNEEFYNLLDKLTVDQLKYMVNSCLISFDELDSQATKSQIINVIINRTHPDLHLYLVSFYDEKGMRFANKVMTASEWIDNLKNI